MQVKKDPGRVDIRYVKGVGPRKADVFRKVSVDTVADLLHYLPRRYEDRRRIVPMGQLAPSAEQATLGVVEKSSFFTARTGTRILTVTFLDGPDELHGIWYNQPYLKDKFRKGDRVLLYGRAEKKGCFEMVHPAFEVMTPGEDDVRSLNIGRIVPVYPLTRGLNQKHLRSVMHRAVQEYSPHLIDILPTPLRARNRLVDIRFAIENIHFPHSFENLERAYHRMVFEEFYLLQTVMALKRRNIRKRGLSHKVAEKALDEFGSFFDFEFTGHQRKAMAAIERDMASEKPMYRLVQGDVGSGKTVVAMYALYLCLENARQGVIVAPTDVLARQHYVNISQLFMPLGRNVRLLSGKMSSGERSRVLKDISSGEAEIIVGTHAAFQADVNYRDLGLAVIDEQHKFGVEQRKKLIEKGLSPDTLVMTATPIPRSLALTVFGDMDVSVIREKPAGRQPVSTWCIDPSRKAAAYDFLREEIARGRQAFVICPRIAENLSVEMASAEKEYRHLAGQVFPEFQVALMHGSMDGDRRREIMEDFRNGGYDVLVATTVVEVGVDIPNATVMMIEDADRYGLAQLHQLRGRIGRGEEASYCILVSSSDNELARERLDSFVGSEDGFQIAEKDMDMRGPGELLGKRQSGLPELKFGDLAADLEVMQMARSEAFKAVEDDPGLDKGHNRQLREAIDRKFKKTLFERCG